MNASLMLMLMVALFAQSASVQQPQSACQFAILQARPEPAMKGAEEIISRVRFLSQPDSPVAVSSIDFHDSELTASDTTYAWSAGERTVEIVNVSNQSVSDVRVAISSRWPSGSGTGGAVISSRSLRPGERAAFPGRQGRAHSVEPTGGKLTVDIFIESVTIGDCVYKPSLAIPPQW
jgi:hypothetical protein